jgi:hypothetical protein
MDSNIQENCLNRFFIHGCGSYAKDILASSKTAIVQGNTSKGIFLRFPCDKIIFLSFEKYTGPLTINIRESVSHLRRLMVGSPVLIFQNKLYFPFEKIVIYLNNKEGWKPHLPNNELRSQKDREEIIQILTDNLLCQTGGSGLSGLLPQLIGFPLSHQYQQNELLLSRIRQARSCLVTRHEEAIEALAYFLGRGGGLTPSGDDFIHGLFLTLNRWREVLMPNVHLHKINKIIIDLAYQTTTTISANLIECGSLGLADERLIAVVDALLTKMENPIAHLDELLTWGATSGGDSFVGMVVALTPY